MVLVKKIKLYKYSVPLKGEFRISFGTTLKAEGLIIVLEDDEGIKGYGEASPASKILGTTPEISFSAIKRLGPLIINKELQPRDVHEILHSSLNYNGDAKAALEIGFLDLWCKKRKKPLYRCLGGSRNEFVTDMTIGIKNVEETIKDAEEYLNEGFKYLKLKLGEGYQKDVERVKALRDAIGYDVHLKVDANQGWSLKEAIRIGRALEKYEIDLIEQPLKYWMIPQHAELRKFIEIPIALDESVHTSKDAIRAIKEGAADIINIKLMKSGGILEGEKIATISESSGIPNMIGCMIETRLAITAAGHLVGIAKNIVHIDLDSDISLKWDPVSGGAEHLGGGKRRLNDTPGLGVNIDFNKLEYIGEITEEKSSLYI